MSPSPQLTPQMEELIKKYSQPAPPTPGLGHSISNLLSPSGLAGGLWEYIKGAGQTLNQAAIDATQAISPVQLPGASFPLYPVNSLKDVPVGVMDRLSFLGNAIGLGIPGAMGKRVGEEDIANPPTTEEQQLKNQLKGIGSNLLYDILPGSELANIFKGQTTNAQGEVVPSKPADTYRDLLTGLTKSLVLAPLATTRSTPKPSIRNNPFARKVVSTGEIQAAKTKPITSTTPPPELELSKAVGQVLDRPEFQDITNKVITSEVINDVVKNNPPGSLKFEQIAEAISRGALEATDLAPIVAKYGLDVESMAKEVSDLYAKTSSFGGGVLNDLSRAELIRDAATTAEAFAGNTKAREILRNNLKRYLDDPETQGLGKLATFAKWANNGPERIRTTLMVSQPTSVMRNIVSQGMIDMSQMFGHLASGLSEAVSGTPWKSAFADLAHDFSSLIGTIKGENLPQIERILDSVPLVKLKLKLGSQFETGSAYVRNLLQKEGPRGLVEFGQDVADLINTPNAMQEEFYRKLFFDQRLGANLDALGLKTTIEDGKVVSWRSKILNELNTTKELKPDYKAAIADAMTHALKQTLAYTPEGPIAKNILSLYQNIPFMKAIAPPFPRFIMNQYLWQLERSPLHFMDLLSKEFRDQLGSVDKLTSREAARRLGQATEGLALLSAAYAVRNSPYAGPKYYQIYLGEDRDGKHQYDDTRPYQPFNTYLYLADLITRSQKSLPSNLTIDEDLDATAGIRRAADYPIFDIVKELRDVKSSTEALEKFLSTKAGQYMASFLTPLKGYEELSTGVAQGVAEVLGINEPRSVGENLTKRDLKGQELTGPTRVVTSPTSLPPHIDPYSGDIDKIDHPLFHQAIGVNRESVSALEKLVLELPNIKMSDLFGSYKDPRANMAVRREIGTKLSQVVERRGDRDVTVGDIIAKKFNEANIKPEVKRDIFYELMRQERQAALEKVRAAHPEFFVEELLFEGKPTIEREINKEGLKRSNIK